MEAGAAASRTPSLRPPGAGEPRTLGRLREEFAGVPEAIARGAGGFAAFARRTVVSSPSAFVYLGETVRQVGILVTGSALLIWFMTFVIGTMCGIEAVYSLRGFGATAFSGGFTALCGTREMAPYMFAYIISAKIGCGLVAELGAMRINEEIDALATTGIDPYRFLIAPRFVAALFALPLLFLVGLAFTNLGHFMTVVVQVGEVSQGSWERIHWGVLDPQTIVFATLKAWLMGSVIILVALYYGFTASGGPVGVGSATARSMVVNLVVLNLTGTLMTLILWGIDARIPIGG